jgi:hypothetical protein
VLDVETAGLTGAAVASEVDVLAAVPCSGVVGGGELPDPVGAVMVLDASDVVCASSLGPLPVGGELTEAFTVGGVDDVPEVVGADASAPPDWVVDVARPVPPVVVPTGVEVAEPAVLVAADIA